MSEELTTMEATTTPEHRGGLVAAFKRLYHGETTIDFVGRTRMWFTISGVVILLGLGSMVFQGLHLGIDFKGGQSWTVLDKNAVAADVQRIVEQAGLPQPTVQILGNRTVQVQADLAALPEKKQEAITKQVTHALARYAGVKASAVSESKVGPTWGGEVTNRAIIALIVFLLAVGLYISIRFEPRMAIAAFLAMIHDILITLGIYSLAGFEVTPDTVVALLTILGYSLYDTIVVFDRVRDNTRLLGGSGRYTYDELLNLSMNQTLARSINTSLVAILPVLSVLLIGAELLGATTLQNYGVALVVGLFAGAYSSIFIASPALGVLKRRDPRWQATNARVESRDRRAAAAEARAAARSASAAPETRGGGVAKASGIITPGSAQHAGTITPRAPKRRARGKRKG